MARLSVGLICGAAMLAVSLTGCATESQSTSVSTPASISPAPPAAPTAYRLVAGRNIKVERDFFEFGYSWPGEAAAIPTLNAHFEGLAAAAQLELEGAFAADERFSDPNEEYKPIYAADYDWKAEAQSGPLLSLSGAWYSYMGGAHGMYGVNAFVFDVKTDSIVASTGLIGNTAAFRTAMQEEFCRLLDTEREDRRGEPVSRDDMFGDCIDPLEQTVIWKSSAGSDVFDRVEIFVGPYAAGSYAEGSYVLNLPITAPMKAAIHPQYQDYFAVNGANPYVVEDQ